MPISKETLITIMGGKQTVPRCQDINEKTGLQCKRPARKGSTTCMSSVVAVADDVVIEPAQETRSERARRWLMMLERVIRFPISMR